MKLTAEQISVINRYVDRNQIDAEKLVSYLEKHKTVTSDVFDYCAREKRRFGEHGFCMYLKDAPMGNTRENTAVAHPIWTKNISKAPLSWHSIL